MKNLWQQLRKDGLRIGAVHVGVDLVPFSFGTISSDEDSVREYTLKWLENTMKIMKDVNVNRLIIYPGSKRNYSYLEDAGVYHTGSQTLPSLKRLAVTAKKYNIDILVETIQNQETYRGSKALLELISRVNSPNVKPALNIANVRLQNENPLEAIEELGKDKALEYVHLSNYKRFPNGIRLNNYCSLMQGEISMDVYRQIFKNRQKQGLPVCIYMLTADRPLESLRLVVLSLRK